MTDMQLSKGEIQDFRELCSAHLKLEVSCDKALGMAIDLIRLLELASLPIDLGEVEVTGHKKNNKNNSSEDKNEKANIPEK